MWKERVLQKLDCLQKRIGHTQILPLEHEIVDLYVKIENQNFMGSVKARAAFTIIRNAVENDLIQENTQVIEASSGNFAVSCAAICKMIGAKFIAVIDPLINRSYEKLIEFFAHDVIKVHKKDGNQGYLLTKLEMVRTFCEKNPQGYWLNQYENENNFNAHYFGTAEEIIKDFPSLDYAFIAVATGGTISGISCRLKEYYPNIKIIAVDAVGSVIFGGRPRPRYIPGMGSGIKPPLINRADINDVIRVAEADTIAACHELFLNYGLFLGGSSGTVYHGVKAYFQDRIFAHKPKVLFLSPDGGNGYVDNIFDRDWITWFANKEEDIPLAI